MSWACFGTTEYHAQIRNRVCSEIQSHWDFYNEFILDEERKNYLANMRKTGTWGDHRTLQAFCNVYNQHVCLMDLEGKPILVKPSKEKKNVKASEWLVITYDKYSMHYDSVDPYYSSPTAKMVRRAQSKA